VEKRAMQLKYLKESFIVLDRISSAYKHVHFAKFLKFLLANYPFERQADSQHQLTTDNFISIMKNPTQPFVVLAARSAEGGTLQGNIASLKSAGKNWEQKEGSDKWVRGAVLFGWTGISRGAFLLFPFLDNKY
jgi:hypothetical protein